MTQMLSEMFFRLGSLDVPSKRELAEFALCYAAALTLAFGMTILVGWQPWN